MVRQNLSGYCFFDFAQKAKRSFVLWVLLFLLFFAISARAEEGGVPSSERKGIPIKFGGDVRVRQTYFDNVPYYKDVHFTPTDFLRLRSRLWVEIKPTEDLSFKVRAVNEFRKYFEPFKIRAVNEFRKYFEPSDKTSYRFPDEIFIDQLYMDIRNLCNGELDFRIGRQDMRYGTGRIIANGTPKSSGRTEYFDAIKLTWKGIKDTQIDIIGIYNKPTNQLIINSQGRDLTGYPASRTWMTETGAGIYIKNKTFPDVPFEAYNIFKRESSWDYNADDPSYSLAGYQTLNPDTDMIETPVLNYNTIGLRIMPKFTEAIEGNFEAAYQFGRYEGGPSKTGYMTDLYLKWKMPLVREIKPVMGLGWYYLSGADPNTKKNEGWTSPFARGAGYSLIYSTTLSYEDAARWSNMSMYYADMTITPFQWLKTILTVGYLLAPVKDGPGEGNVRGWLTAIQADFKLGKDLLKKNDALTGNFRFETLKSGNYYSDNDYAYYARWEIVYTF
ncbi:MAG: alginate export family protein [Proteobacteria bacterium]|nr:alginate export family protein [Pseudomonadota bacterium]